MTDLESAQRRFTKRLRGLQNLDYIQRLNTLELRRLTTDMILLHEI